MTNFKLNLVAYAVLIGLSAQYSYAEETEQEVLNEVVVSGESEGVDSKTPPKIAETITSSKKLERQQAQDVKDIVRYDTGITVVDAGRFGNSGFAVRGVEENRVAIQIDGLQQAETISSQGFKELFEGYGNFNNTRNSAEIETLKQVTIRKGADSLKSGSGALGGSVSFDTKDARDYLLEKNYYASYKRGYNSADNQHLNTLTLAGRYKYFDALVVATTRRGHELENYGYKYYDNNVQGKTREKADPYKRSLDSALMKFAFQPTENHRFTAIVDLYKQTSKGHDFSYNLKPPITLGKEGETQPELELRHTNDKVERKNFAFSYENFNQTPLWDTLKITYSQQKITTRARTDDYCDGNENCPLSTNPLGMKYDDQNRLVGADGQLASYHDKPAMNLPDSDVEIDVPVKPYDGSYDNYFKWKRVDWDNLPSGYYVKPGYKFCDDDYSRWFGPKPQVGTADTCKATLTKLGSNIPADKQFSINGKSYNLLGEDKNVITDEQLIATNTPVMLSCDAINCDKKSISAFNKDGSTTEIPFSVVEREGKKFAQTEAQNTSALNSPKIVLPNKAGYQSNLWSQRDLTSKTKQINLDLTKHISLFDTEHDFSYGAVWSEMKKSMTNISGDSPRDVKWWAQYPVNCATHLDENTLNPDRHHTLCNNRNVFSFLIPVKTKTGALYFIDDVRINDYLAFNVGYRYDRIKYKPEYIPGVTPKIPDDMVTNLYVKDPSFNPNDLTSKENLAKKEANANANIKEITQPKKFSASSYSFGSTIDPLNWLRVQVKYSKAFRAPTSDEIYFTFKHPDFSVLPNKDLKPEIAKTKELSVTFHNDMGYISGSVFETKYDNFIDLSYKGLYGLQGHSKLRPFNVYQNINRQNAKVNGFEIASQITLGNVIKALNGFYLSYKYTYQKGRMDEDIPMNAIQPRMAVYGLGYAHPDDKFGLDLYVSHASAKEAKDTYNMYHKEEGTNDTTIKWRSDAYTTIDLLGYIKPIKNLTLRAGIYNLTDRKYITWDSARSIRPFGTSNMIDQNTGLGINRFYAAGRNYRLSVQFEF